MSCCGAFVMPIDLPSRPIASPSAQSAPRPLTGGHVLAMMLAFFAVILTVNLVMMTYAIRTMPGVAAKSAYEASQRFNTELAAIAAQDRRGWQVDIATGALETGGRLGVSVRDGAGEPVNGLAGEVRFERPTDKRLDRTFPLQLRGDGVYAAEIERLVPGQWDLIVEFLRDEARQHVSRRRIVVRG